MGNFRCKVCRAEYDSIPLECTAPGCRNSNPALFEFIGETEQTDPNEQIYNDALQYASSNDLDSLSKALELFGSISSYRDVPQRIAECEDRIQKIKQKNEINNKEKSKTHTDPDTIKGSVVPPNESEGDYLKALELYNTGSLQKIRDAKSIFLSIPDYKDSGKMIKKCDKAIAACSKTIYAQAKQLYAHKDYARSMELFESLRSYKDSVLMVEKCKKKMIDNPKPKGLIILLVVLIAAVVGVGAFFALQYFVFDKQPHKEPEPAVAAADTPEPTVAATDAPEPTVIETVVKEVSDVEPVLDSIAFYRKPTDDHNFIETNVCLYDDDYQYEIKYLFKNAEALTDTDSSIDVVISNPDSDSILREKTLYFKNLNPGTTGWNSDFDKGDFKAGKLEIKIYSDKGKLIGSDSIDVYSSVEEATDKKYNSVKEYVDSENKSIDFTENGVRGQVYASSENALLYKYTYTQQVDEKEAARHISSNEDDILSGCKETMNKDLKPNINEDQWERIAIFYMFYNYDGSLIKWYQYTINDGFEVLI